MGSDRRTLCGLGPNDPRRFPYVGAPFVAAHVAGHGLVICEACSVELARRKTARSDRP